MPDVTGDGLMKQQNNPEVEVNVQQPSIVISQQELQLHLINNKLRNAYAGLDVDWMDTADVGGSGSGSGDRPNDDEEEGSADMGSGVDHTDTHTYPKTHDKYPDIDWNSNNDMNFNNNNQPDNYPTIVQTRRPPASHDNYNQNTHIYQSGCPCHRPASTILLLSVLAILVLQH